MHRLIIKLGIAAGMLMMIFNPLAVHALSINSPKPALVNHVVFADTQSRLDACAGLSAVDNTQDCSAKDDSVNNIVRAVVNILSYLVGIAAVIVVILAGFKYITSGGDSGSISSAKNTLIYALVGIVVAVSAQVIVHFAFNAATSSACASNPGILASSASCKK